MSIAETKDKIAQWNGYKDWKDIDVVLGNGPVATKVKLELMDKVVEYWAMQKAKDFKIWCDHQVIAGRTTHKLFLDWKGVTSGQA